jgi:indole-3-glycerol phosphate synthase
MANAFTEALLASDLPIIMEVKRQDADGGPIMGDRTIPDVVSQYLAVGAPCISVVTGKWFGGTESMLAEVAELTDVPLLRKDFITREKQIVAAKEMGASAILLTAKILPSKTFQHLIELALGHGLTPFVEIVDEAELGSVIHAEDCIIAINNKDINTREREAGDIDLSRSLLDAVIDTGTPCPVSASAILDPRVAAELVTAGFKGLLIGTGLLRADSVKGFVEEFERRRAELRESVAPPSATPGAR